MIKKYSTNQALIGSGFNQPAGTGFTLTLSGNTIIANSGTFQYATNRSTYFNVTPRAVPDVAYVTGQTAKINYVGSVGQIIYRGISGITGATGFIYDKATSGVTVPNLIISTTPVTDLSLDWLLSWDCNTGKVKKICYSSAVGLTCAENGLTSVGGLVCLGGNLCTDTIICGADSYSLSFKNLCNACIITTANNIVLDSRCNSGGVYLKSQSGAINSPVSNYANSIGFAMDYPSNIFKIYDNRIGANQKGIEYDNNYSAFFTPRSLVDKSYVDAIAAGLQPHPAVLVATSGVTDNRVLSGLTGTTIVDGVVLSQGDRVLIKNQTDAKQNGIYILSGTTFTRAIDFNQSSETVQGAYTFVLSGNTWQYTSWILSTPNPITINVTPLTFSLFAQVTDILAGTGISITKYYGQDTVSVNGSVLAGNSILWTGNTFNVDINGGTLVIALNSKLATSIFTGYTASTSGLIGAAITGATNGLTKTGRNVKLGGALTGNTIITGAYNFGVNTSNINLTGGSAINLTGTVKLISTPLSGTTTDAILVWNSVDKKIKQISQNIVNVCNVISTYTATSNDSFIGVSGASLICLLNTPYCGQRVTIADICGNALSSPITICSNKRINDSLSCSSLINTNYGSITFIFNGYFWSAVAFIN
jgi:hypothetical protein